MSNRTGTPQRRPAVVLSMLVVMGAGRLWAQSPLTESRAPARATTAKAWMALKPSELVATLHQVNQMEIAAGRMAEKQGASRDVKDFGRMLVADHQTADDDITAYASSKGIALNDVPSQVAAQQEKVRAEMRALQDTRGPSFDQRFALDMAKAHEKVIAMIDASGSAVRDEGLVILLDTLKPTLRKHLAMADDILNGTSGSAGNAASHGATAHGRRGPVR